MSTLLPELIIEILLRLPIKSICRFKCTSKSWLALITHPQFIKMHLARTRKQKLLLCNPYVNAHLCLVDLERSFEDKVHPKVDQLNIKPNIQYVECICGSNGLFYIKFEYHDSSFFICNPSTRESKEILDVPLLNSSYFVGFGYVESIDDYKAVRVFNDQKLLHIFSLRNNSWKIVAGNFPVRQPSIIDGVSLNGAVHWGTLCYPDDLGVITVFDLAEEKFKTFPLPISNAPPNPPEYWRCNVHVIGEYLCVTFEVFIDRTTECVEAVDGIWIMKEYGVKESWIRIVKSHGLCDPIPLCLWENDGIILFFSYFGQQPKRVLCYDQKDGKLRKEFVIEGKYIIYAYVESLVSFKYNLEYSSTQGFLHNFAPSQLQSTSQIPSSSSVSLDISGLLTEDQLV